MAVFSQIARRLLKAWIGPASTSPAGQLSLEDVLLALRNAVVVALLTFGIELGRGLDALDWGGIDPLIAAVAVFVENLLAQRLREQSRPADEGAGGGTEI